MINKMLNSNNPSYYEFSEEELARIDPSNYPDLFDDTIYESDEFRMYGFKIKKCPRMRSHDWIMCPFVHRGEKARRRDPRRYNYSAAPCPDYRDQYCIRGDACHYAHGVFEYWLHPSKYRTRACNAGPDCHRKVCFFAHSPPELRDDAKYHHYSYVGTDDGNPTPPNTPIHHREPVHHGIPSAAAIPFVPAAARAAVVRGAAAAAGGRGRRSGTGGVSRRNSDFLASLSGLNITEGEGSGSGMFPWGVGQRSTAADPPAPETDEEEPDIEWITDLME